MSEYGGPPEKRCPVCESWFWCGKWRYGGRRCGMTPGGYVPFARDYDVGSKPERSIWHRLFYGERG